MLTSSLRSASLRSFSPPPVLVLCLLASLSTLPAQSLTALVNDTVSHGKVSDGSLSLDEAVRLANGTLALSALSTAEKARVSGSGGAVEAIVIDAAVTPTIKLEQALSTIQTKVHIRGVVDQGKKPVLDLGSQAVGLSIRTHLAQLSDLSIVGGGVAVEATTTQGSLITPVRIFDVDTSNQAKACYQFHASSTDKAAFYIVGGTLRNAPMGFDLDDNGNGGQLLVEGEFLNFTNVTLGIDLVVNSSNGTSICRYWRSNFLDGDTFMKVRRATTSTQRQVLRVVHGHYESKSDLFDVQGNTAGETAFFHHHALFKAAAGKKALWVYPADAWFDVHGSEMVFEGDVTIQCGKATPRIFSHNNVFRNLTLQIDNDGAAPDMLWNRYENCRFDVLSGNTTAFTIFGSEFYNATVTDSSTTSPLTLTDAYLSNTTTSGAVKVTNTLPAPWQGSTALSDPEPRVGTWVALASYVPANMDLIWTVGLGLPRPLTTAFPFRFYMYVPTLVIFAQPPVGSGLRLTPVLIPGDQALAGIEFYFQGVSYPTASQNLVPPLYLPTGARMIPRL